MGPDQARLFGPTKRERGRYRANLDRTVKVLVATHRLEPDADAALISLNRVLADNLDAADRAALTGDESRFTVGTIAGRAQAALMLLLDRDNADDDFLDDMLARMAHPANGEPSN